MPDSKPNDDPDLKLSASGIGDLVPAFLFVLWLVIGGSLFLAVCELRVLFFVLSSYNVAPWSEITPCNKIDKPLYFITSSEFNAYQM